MWREGWVMGGDTRFFVRALGHGDRVALLLHGWPETSDSWRRVAPILADRGYRVVCPDLKGLGRSDKPHRGYDPETLADEISQLIRNLHTDRALLVGHDWGGAVALATAFRHPGRVHGLVLASAPYRQLDLTRAFHIPLFNLPVLPELWFKLAPSQLVRLAVRFGAWQEEGFDEQRLEEYARGVAADPRAWLSYYRTLSRRAVVDWSVRKVRRRLSRGSGGRSVHRLPVPAHVVWGDRDPATPAHLAPRVAFDLGASLTLLEDVGHFPHEEDPRGFAGAILRFATSLEEGGAGSGGDVVPLRARDGSRAS